MIPAPHKLDGARQALLRATDELLLASSTCSIEQARHVNRAIDEVMKAGGLLRLTVQVEEDA